MKIRNPWLIRVAAFLVSILMRWWMGTVRFVVQKKDRYVDPDHPDLPGPCIYAIWHEAILFSAGWKPKSPIHILVSQHADGELIAQVTHLLGFGTVRGSSTRGGLGALQELIEKGRKSHLIVTPDGPRGPRRHLQEGVVFLASRTGMPIVPIGVGFSSAWRARSWDRLAIPMPWSKICVTAGQLVRVPPDLDRTGLEEYRTQVEQQMGQATVVAEMLAAGRD